MAGSSRTPVRGSASHLAHGTSGPDCNEAQGAQVGSGPGAGQVFRSQERARSPPPASPTPHTQSATAGMGWLSGFQRESQDPQKQGPPFCPW